METYGYIKNVDVTSELLSKFRLILTSLSNVFTGTCTKVKGILDKYPIISTIVMLFVWCCYSEYWNLTNEFKADQKLKFLNGEEACDIYSNSNIFMKMFRQSVKTECEHHKKMKEILWTKSFSFIEVVVSMFSRIPIIYLDANLQGVNRIISSENFFYRSILKTPFLMFSLGMPSYFITIICLFIFVQKFAPDLTVYNIYKRLRNILL
ncbi:unnamed protein product [Chironomus riparius]|uniref:Uncharacterized protein n=1 Tax=Chironomus riparius TaxID=315576 RepID=A0A9N9S9D4_9DIPT|nr:unnamed protein product [Chironomus riparius]